jgi:hypothetical protein
MKFGSLSSIFASISERILIDIERVFERASNRNLFSLFLSLRVFGRSRAGWQYRYNIAKPSEI